MTLGIREKPNKGKNMLRRKRFVVCLWLFATLSHADEQPQPERLKNEEAEKKASVEGKYQNLLKKIEVESDVKPYSAFRDWGHSNTKSYAGHKDLPAGYWVYVYPHWYIWGDMALNDAVIADFPAEIAFDAIGPAAAMQGRSWGPEQATGEPDTHVAGDVQTAWASLTPDGQEEWLDLTYEQAVIPKAVHVHETFNPGALTKVSIYTADEQEHVVWEGEDPTKVGAGNGVSKIEFATGKKTRRVRIYLDSPEVAGWNEIDAVGLVADDGEIQWAEQADASSTFADQAVAAIGGLAQPVQAMNNDLRGVLEEREKQLARLLKKLRKTSQKMDEQAAEFSKQREKFQKELKAVKQSNVDLRAENERLKKRLESD